MKEIVKANMLPIVAACAALVFCLGGWLLLPSLQGDQRTVDAQASQQLERARRLLDQYQAVLDFKSLLLDQLRDLDLDVDVSDVDELLDSAGDEYEARFEDAWTRYRPVDWQADPPRAARAGGSPQGQIRDGVSQRHALLADNSRLLDEALSAVSEALQIQHGDASSGSYAEASRLKGAILYHMGVRAWIGSSRKRVESGPLRRQLTALSTRAAALDGARMLVEHSGIEERITELQGRADEAGRELADDQTQLASIDADIAGLERRLADARSRAARARAALDGLEASGLDFSDPDAAETFASQVLQQSDLYRRSTREAHGLESGDYVSAEIDHTGDLLNGCYLGPGSEDEPDVRYGLAHYHDAREVVSTRMALRGQALDDLRSGIARLKGMRDSVAQEQEAAGREWAEIKTRAEDTYAQLNLMESEAFALEEKGLDLLGQSARLARQAAGDARSWIQGDRGGAASPSAVAKRQEGGWMAGYIKAQEADAKLARAWIFADRFHAYTETAKTLAALPESMMPTEADVEQEQTKATEAHDAGVTEINEAMALLERVHGDVGRHWTITAQAAGTVYVLALLGHKDYVSEAVEAYRLAVSGREDKPYAAKFVSRLKVLEDR